MIRTVQLKLSFNKNKQRNKKLKKTNSDTVLPLSIISLAVVFVLLSFQLDQPLTPDCPITIPIEFMHSFLAAIDINMCSCMTHQSWFLCLGVCLLELLV